MEQDFQHCTLLSCSYQPLVKHAYQCEKSGLSCKRFEYAYMLEKNIGPPNKAMPNHGGSFSMDILNHISLVKITIHLVFQEDSICWLSCRPSIYMAFEKRFSQISKGTLYRRHGGTEGDMP
jgi:hypothetical protein